MIVSPPDLIVKELLALAEERIVKLERETMARNFNEWAQDARDHGSPRVPIAPITLEIAASLLRAPQQQAEPVAEITDVQGSLNDICIVTWRKHQPIPPVGTLLYVAPPPDDEATLQNMERFRNAGIAMEIDRDEAVRLLIGVSSLEGEDLFARWLPAVRAYLSRKEPKG
jgi:hypothetical protein